MLGKDEGSLEGALDRLWDLFDELLGFAGFQACRDALAAERLCNRGPVPNVAFMRAAEARTYSEGAGNALADCVSREERAIFEQGWTRHVPASCAAASLRAAKLKCAALFALAPLRRRLRDRNLTDYPSDVEEIDASRALGAAIADGPLPDDPDLLPLLALPNLRRPWDQPALAALLFEDRSWLSFKSAFGGRAASLRDDVGSRRRRPSSSRVAAPPRPRRGQDWSRRRRGRTADRPRTGRGAAAAATWTGLVATPPRPRRG